MRIPPQSTVRIDDERTTILRKPAFRQIVKRQRITAPPPQSRPNGACLAHAQRRLEKIGGGLQATLCFWLYSGITAYKKTSKLGDVVGLADELLGVIDDVYAGVLDNQRLSASLLRVARTVSAAGGMIYTQCPGEQGLRFAVFSNIDMEALRSVGAEDAQMVSRFALQIPLGHVRSVESTWPIDAMKRTSFYETFLKNLGFMHGASGMLQRNASSYSQFTMTRTAHQGSFDNEKIAALEIVAPHLRNVLRISNAIGTAEHARETLATVLDNVSDGIALTDRTRKIIHLNRAAERMFASNDGLSIRSGYLAAGQADERRKLDGLIAQAASRNRGSFARGGTCAISRPSGALPWLVLAVPCGDRQASAYAPLSPACTVIVRDSSQPPQSADSLRQIFDLTAQEAKVAAQVAHGRGLADAARALGLSPLTVRNHLQRVFAKTGVRRQAELTRLLTSLN